MKYAPLQDGLLGVILLCIICIAVATIAYEPAPAQIPDTEARMTAGLITLDQAEKRTIYVRPDAVQSFVMWPNHPEVDNPAVVLIVGAREYRLDCKTLEKAKAVESFLLDNLKAKNVVSN